MFKGKRELLSQCIYWSGITYLLTHAPARDTLLILAYHRLGDFSHDPFDSDLFSATADHFDEQITYLKRNASIISLEELRSMAAGDIKDRRPRSRVLLTFDDGYLDNYQIAFPIMRSHGVQGVFFLSTGLMGTSAIPWWDEIAFTLKTACRSRFSLRYPADLEVDLARDGMPQSIRCVIRLYKQPGNTDQSRFLEELKVASDPAESFPKSTRRFLDWNEAQAMITGGMTIGSHCHSHRVLNQLTLDQQRHELAYSRQHLQERLGVTIDSVAYPVGLRNSFSDQTERLAREAGYRLAFSYYGGTNPAGLHSNPYDVKRIGVFAQKSQLRFRVQATNWRATGHYWP
jgi:peptidoglycan/xylan/chitin deacetylase (PgdA/CDA1 family)